MRSMRPGLVEIVEACYRFDEDLDGWMKSVAGAIEAHFGYGLGAIAIRYRLGKNLEFEPMTMIPVGMPNDRVAIIQRATANLPATYVKETFASLPAALACSSGSEHTRALTTKLFGRYFEPLGWHDIACVNALDPTHDGLYVGAFMPSRGSMSPRMQLRWSRIAAHIAAAHRLQARVSREELSDLGAAEAVLAPSGRLEHARADAKQEALQTVLARGVRAIERARGGLRRTEPDLALAEWRALLAARWTLVDHFESDGKRYIVARRNAATPHGLEALASREREALGFAQLGHSNKLIAYEMGLAASTVAVLLHRAARKLGCEREHLVDVYERLLRSSP